MKKTSLLLLVTFLSSVSNALVLNYNCKNNQDSNFSIKFDNSRFIIKSQKAICFGTGKEVVKVNNHNSIKISLAQIKIKDSELFEVDSKQKELAKCVLFQSSLQDHNDLEIAKYIVLSDEILTGKTAGKVFIDGFMTRGQSSCTRIQ